MAVQAQYPSNVLFLNRNVQDGKQQQPVGRGGGFMDQSSHMIFNNGGPNPRKRGRETDTPVHGGAGVRPAMANQNIGLNDNKQPFPIQSSLQQPPPTQLIDLSLLNRAQPNISTGLRLSSDQHHPPPPQLLNLHHYQQNLNTNLVAPQSSSPISSSLLSENLATHVKRHREELDQLLLSHGEELRRTLAEKRQRQYRVLVGAAEEALGRRLREKEAEVEKASRQQAELEARAAQLSVEAQVWQAKARAQEASIASLQAQLHHAIIAAPLANNDDGSGVGEQAEDAGSAYEDPDRVTAVSSTNGAGPCRSCGRRVARVVILPCRHLCICTECDQVVQACPVCLHHRHSSVEVLLC